MIQKRKRVDPKQLISFRIVPGNVVVQASHTMTIMEALEEAKIPIEGSCGGMGTCGTCRIFVEEGLEKLGPRNEPESEIAHDRKFIEKERLSCQYFVKDGIVIRKA